MSYSHVRLALVALVSLVPQGAMACGAEADATGSPLQTRTPVVGEAARLTETFGMRRHPLLMTERMHTGVDWAAPRGTPVAASGPGRIVWAKMDGEFGNKVVIDHGAGWQTVYSQLSQFNVREGDCVEVRQVIGAVGSTGLSPEDHLHYEVRRNGQPIDPMDAPLGK